MTPSGKPGIAVTFRTVGLLCVLAGCSDASRSTAPSKLSVKDVPSLGANAKGGPNAVECAKAYSVAVTLSPSQLSVGGSVTASVIVLASNGRTVNGQEITWSTSQPAVATVSSSGIVSAIAAGAAIIQATVAGCSGSATLNVVASAPSVATVQIAVNPLSITLGTSAQATASIKDAAGRTLNGQTVIWNSRSPWIATVSQTGVVSALSAGTAIIEGTAGGVTGTASIGVPDAGHLTVSPAPAPEPTPTPAPAPAPPTGVIAYADFENGSTGTFGSAGGSVVNDPTGAFGGKVYQIRYTGNYSVNLSLDHLMPSGSGITNIVSFQGDVYIPRPAKENVMRKLFYLHNNPYAYGGSYVANRVSAVLGVMGNSIYWAGGRNVQAQFNNLGTIPYDTKVNIKVEHNLGSIGSANGVVRIWVNGNLIWTSPGMNFRQDAYDGLGFFQIGEQAQTFDGSPVDEVRYWNNVSIANGPIN